MTDRNINHFEKAIALVKEILKDDGGPQDFAGNTRLTLLADKIKSLLPAYEMKRSYYIFAIEACAKILKDFSIDEIKNLCELIHLAELKSFEFHKAFLNGFNKWKKTPSNVWERAEIFRLIGESGSDMEISFIHKEIEIKKVFPWYWIDVAMYLNRDGAIILIKNQIKTNEDFTPALQRLSHWWDLYEDKEKYYSELLSPLLKSAPQGGEVRKTARSLLTVFGVPEERIGDLLGEKIPTCALWRFTSNQLDFSEEDYLHVAKLYSIER